MSTDSFLLFKDQVAIARSRGRHRRRDCAAFSTRTGKHRDRRSRPPQPHRPQIPSAVRPTRGVSLTMGVTEGAVFRAINKAGRIAPNGFSPKVIWGIVKQASARCGLANVAPHDLRRTCARLCHQAGGELEQIQFLLGHVSVQTTERYLGCKQRLRNAVNDNIGLEPQA